jgi:O-antigen/teichoic acid export membrane protein
MLLPSVASGVRWTFWLAVLAVPFSYATTLLLARLGPDVLGVYGVLGVYASAVGSFFYIGGNAVTIRYVSELKDGKRLSFLVSYLAALLVALAPWLIAATMWPRSLSYVFGEVGDTRFQLLVVWLSPVYVLLLLVQSALKGTLDMAWAQGLSRAIPIGSFLVYALLVTISPMTLVVHHTPLIWGVFLSLAAAAAVAGICRLLMSLSLAGESLRDVRVFLPDGFWKYTAGVQGSSVLGFFSINLDSLMILHAGGVAVLGRYVAVMTIALAIPLLSGFLLESLVPILMTALGQKKPQSAREITELFGRMIFPIVLGVAAFEIFLGRPLANLLGTQYTDISGFIQLVAPFAAVQALSAYLGTLLVVTGSPHYEALGRTLRIAVFAISFQFLWVPYQLLGSVLAWAIAEMSYHGVALYLVKRNVGYQFSLSRTYAAFIVVLALCAGSMAAVLHSAPLPLLLASWLGSLTLFARLAGYTLREIQDIGTFIAPSLHRSDTHCGAPDAEGHPGR